ncbi:MAG: hypothetical protein J5861_00540 [Desulfovibrio sp.]|nr:hypothetical protein [Desulfovibrio sp.]
MKKIERTYQKNKKNLIQNPRKNKEIYTAGDYAAVSLCQAGSFTFGGGIVSG